MNRIISIDPGQKKCGLLLADLSKDLVLDGRVVIKSSVIEIIPLWHETEAVSSILLGNGTTSKFWLNLLSNFNEITLVEETGSTLRARERYWDLWPPKGLFRLIPRGLILPPEPLDAVAALILLEDHIGRKIAWNQPRDFRIWPVS